MKELILNTSENIPISVKVFEPQISNGKVLLINSATGVKQQIYFSFAKYLAEKGFEPQYGARPVKRVIQREVLNQLSKEILAGNITTDSIILLDSFDGKLVFRNQN